MGIDPSAPAYRDIDRATARIYRQGQTAPVTVHDIADSPFSDVTAALIPVAPDSVLIHQVTTVLPEHSFTEPKRKVKPVCTHCGGSNIFFDAVSAWDVERQEQVMLNTFDNTDCEDCEGECSVNWIEVTE